MIGKNISHYKILEELGRGGMGMVYKARDTKLDRLVALKFLAPHLSQDEEQKARFIHEAKAASALDHPNICNIYEINETEDGQMFIAMACYEGESLQDKIKRGPLPVKDALHIAFQIIRGLEKAHSKGIVHRDIKPANILITNDGQIKIVDFGLAKLARRGVLTREGTTLGTVAYMSPEQTRGTEIDHQTDIWSLGVVLYEMLTGEQPFKGDYEQAVVYSILHEEPEQINGTLSNRVPQELPAVIGKMLSKEVNQRYQNMAELLQQLLKIEKKIETGTEVSGSPGKSAPSIAVLPFVNMSADPENEYFSDGLTEEIIASLSKIRSLKVISRTSIMHYKKSNKPLKQIAGELQVQYVLEGSVRKYGNDLRITAQLIEAAQDTNVWVDKYRGNIEDVFEIQEKVALEIAQALSLQLSPNEEKNLRKRSTENSDAYQLYLKGRYSWYKRTEEGVRNGIEFFKQAIEKDPTYALAQVGIADSYNILGFYSVLAPKEAFPRARSAAEKALAIDDTLAEAYAALAYTFHYHYWDWNAAENQYKKSFNLNERYAIAHQYYANYLVSMGRLEEGIIQFKQTLELDPLSLIANSALGWSYNYARRYEEAIEQFIRAFELDKDFMLTHFWLGHSYIGLSKFSKAIDCFQKAHELSGGSTITLAALGHSYALINEKVKARRILTKFDELSRKKYIDSYLRAKIYIGLADLDRTFEWLQKAYDERSHDLVFLIVDPHLDPLRSDPRYRDLVNKMALNQ